MAVFGADLWTWNCELTAVNLEEFSVWSLDLVAEYSQQFSLDDRKRNPWNHYGAFILLVGAVGLGISNKKKKATAQNCKA